MLTSFRNRLCVAVLTCAGMGISIFWPQAAPAASQPKTAKPVAVANLYGFNTTLFVAWFRNENGRWIQQRCGTGSYGLKAALFHVSQRRQEGCEAYVERCDRWPWQATPRRPAEAGVSTLMSKPLQSGIRG